MSVATMTSKGQVTIPVDIRRELGLAPGVRLSFVPQSGDAIEMRVQRSSLGDLYGSLPRIGSAPTGDDGALGLALAQDDERIRRQYREADA